MGKREIKLILLENSEGWLTSNEIRDKLVECGFDVNLYSVCHALATITGKAYSIVERRRSSPAGGRGNIPYEYRIKKEVQKRLLNRVG